MNIISYLTKTIGILVLLNICLFLIPKPIRKLINMLLNGVNKLFTMMFKYIKDYYSCDIKEEKQSNVIQFKRKAK